MDIKLLVMDVDGTLTDGKIYMSAQGEAVKAFDVKDGYGIVSLLPQCGIRPVIITGRKSEILLRRCEDLKISEVHQGVTDKAARLTEVMEKFGVTAKQVAYIGDDLNDLSCMELAGITACPADAVEIIREKADFCCILPGGRGAVREFIDWLYVQRTEREHIQGE